MEKNPLISIVLPVYNGEKYLSQSVKSCLSQTYSNIELIIVDDCSSDKSFDIAQEYAEKDNRVIIIKNSINKKLPQSLNIGHSVAKGDFLTWTSDDNLYLSNAIETMVKEIKRANVEFVYSDFYIIDNYGKTLMNRRLPKPEFCVWKNVFGASFLYSRKVFFESNGYNNKLFLVEDYDFWLRVTLKFKFRKIDKFLYKYRIHENNLTFEIESKTEKYYLWRKNYKKMLISFYDSLKIENKVELASMVVSIIEKKTIPIKRFIKNKKEYEKLVLNLSKKNSSFNLVILNKIYYEYLYRCFTNSLDVTFLDFIKVVYHYNPFMSFDNLKIMFRRVLINYYKKMI